MYLDTAYSPRLEIGVHTVSDLLGANVVVSAYEASRSTYGGTGGIATRTIYWSSNITKTFNKLEYHCTFNYLTQKVYLTDGTRGNIFVLDKNGNKIGYANADVGSSIKMSDVQTDVGKTIGSWFYDAEMTQPVPSSIPITETGMIKLYGTLRDSDGYVGVVGQTINIAQFIKDELGIVLNYNPPSKTTGWECHEINNLVPEYYLKENSYGVITFLRE